MILNKKKKQINSNLKALEVCVCTFAATFCCGSPHPAIRRGPPHGCAHLGGSKLTAGGRNTSHHPKLLIQILYSPFSLPCVLPFSSPRRAGEPREPPPQLRLAVDAGIALLSRLHRCRPRLPTQREAAERL